MQPHRASGTTTIDRISCHRLCHAPRRSCQDADTVERGATSAPTSPSPGVQALVPTGRG
jgi:hypothetical protein